MFPRCLPAFPHFPAVYIRERSWTTFVQASRCVSGFLRPTFARCPLLISPLACTQWSSGRFLRDGPLPCSTQGLPACRRYSLSPYSNGLLGKSKHGIPGPWLTCNNSLPVRRHPLHGLATITRLVDHAPRTRCAVSCPSHERSLYTLRNRIKARRDPSLGLRRPVWLQVISLARCP